MKRIGTIISVLLLISPVVFSQKISGQLKFTQGQSFEITMETKTTFAQEAMGQAIDFNVDGSATHIYKVTNTTDDNSTLHHQVQKIVFSFDGMGQKRKFDSNNPKDMEGQFGKPIKDVLDKSFDMVIDPNGKVKMTIPEKLETSNSDTRLMIVTNMLKDILGTVQPPQKGEASFFKVLPENETGIGATWTESVNTESEKSITTYKITEINDSTAVIDFAGNSTSVNKTEMMGMEATISMKNKTTGKIIVDKTTGIIRHKNFATESNGTTESSFGTLPITSKIITTINVKPVQ
jgi:hypothetical protein